MIVPMSAKSLAPSKSNKRLLDRQIVALALPALGALIAEPLFLLADTALVGHLGRYALGAVAVGSTVVQTSVGLLLFLAYATTPIVARRFGRGDLRGAVTAGIDGIWLASAIGVVLTVVGALTTDVWVGLMTDDPRVASSAHGFLFVSFLSVLPMLIVFAATGLLRGLQDTRTPLVIVTIGFALNFLLNVLFIYGLNMGVVGSALGTTLTQWLMAITYLAITLRLARKHGANLRPASAGILKTAKDGAWLFVRTLGLRAALVITVVVASKIGATELAGWQLMFAIFTALQMALDALAIAAQAMVGKAIGEGDLAQVREVTGRLKLWGTAFGAAIGLLLVAVHPWVGRLFTSDSGVLMLLSPALVAMGLSLVISGYVFALDGVLMGASDMKYLGLAMIICFAVFLACIVVVTHLPGHNLRLAYLWLAFGVGMMLARAVTLGLRVRGTAWLRANSGDKA